MSADEQCQVKCCERHLMCFISVCLNCPGTLESLSVNRTRRNETRLLSSEDTCLSAVTQPSTRKRGFLSLLKHTRLYDYCPLHISAAGFLLFSFLWLHFHRKKWGTINHLKPASPMKKWNVKIKKVGQCFFLQNVTKKICQFSAVFYYRNT